jgi:hypothetical protein
MTRLNYASNDACLPIHPTPLARRSRPNGAALALAAALATTAAADAHADPVAWDKLAQQPGALSAIATAIAMSGKCEVPFTFDQRRDGDALIIQVACANTGDGAGAVNVKFEAVGKNLFVTGYDFES